MDQEVVQRARYILRARFRRAQTCPTALFAAACRQLLGWLKSHPVLSGHLHRIRRDQQEGATRVLKIGTDLAARVGETQEPRRRQRTSYDPGFYTAASLVDHTAVCLAVLEVVAADNSPRGDEFLQRCLGEYLNGDNDIKLDDAIQTIRDVALDGLFEFLDEELDTRNVVLALLSKYKQRGEWFRRATLRDLAAPQGETRRGERALAMDLYEYLLDQSVEFFVEPVSGSGEPDIVLREPSGRYVILDAKYLTADDPPSAIRRKLASGFHQVARYCDDFNEPVGHLIVFSESTRRLSLDLDEGDGRRFLVLGGRTVYYSDVWLADAPSASKLGKAEEIAITRADLLTETAPGGV